MSVQTLRESTPKARKIHQCSLCTGIIGPGEIYSRTTNVCDGSVYDWLTCKRCTDEEVASYAYNWSYGSGYGITFEDARDWAIEALIHATGDERKAAENFIERSGTYVD